MKHLHSETLAADILILGAGGAGLLAAMHAHEISPRLKIVIAVKGLLGQSGCTRMVQGGYNAVLHPDDSLEKHFTDTVKGGGYINNQELAWKLVEEAPRRIMELENRAGCMFDRNPDGTIHQKPFAGQSFDRTVHKGDLTGIEIMSNLRDYILEQDIQVLQETRGLDLLTGDGRVSGALLLHIRSGSLIAVRARATLLATGAAPTCTASRRPLSKRPATAWPWVSAPAPRFVDMEMLQFHPTGLLVGSSIATGGLLEEGLRGAGARLFNGLGERYMERYDAEKTGARHPGRDLALQLSGDHGRPRHRERRRPHRPQPPRSTISCAAAFRGMVERCRDYGFDLVHDRVEVSPSAHYQMGGVAIGVDCRDFDGVSVRRGRGCRRRPRRESSGRQRRGRFDRLRGARGRQHG